MLEGKGDILGDPVFEANSRSAPSHNLPDEGTMTYLLRVLSDHQDEGKVVHSQSEIEQFVGITEEDDVLDGILCPFSVSRYK